MILIFDVEVQVRLARIQIMGSILLEILIMGEISNKLDSSIP